MIRGRAVRFTGVGGPEVLHLDELQLRPPGPHEVRIAVRAAGLNRADLLQRRGLYPAPPGAPADIPGLEYAGTVEALGSEVRGLRAGDRVMGVVGGGAMATHLVVPEREAVPVPPSLGLEEAAAIPEAFFTAFDALFTQGGLRLGETLLVHAVASGVGTAALQLGLAAGARVIGTSRSPEKLTRCEDLGLRHGVQVAEARFAEEVLAQSEGRGADVILDLVGASYFEENLRALAPRGRIVAVGLLGGGRATLPLGELLRKRATVVGTVLRSRPSEEKAALAQRFHRELSPLFEAGRLRPVVDRVLPFEAIAEAHRLLEESATFGKVVLTWQRRAT